jgi:hypothetical protein
LRLQVARNNNAIAASDNRAIANRLKKVGHSAGVRCVGGDIVRATQEDAVGNRQNQRRADRDNSARDPALFMYFPARGASRYR